MWSWKWQACIYLCCFVISVRSYTVYNKPDELLYCEGIYASSPGGPFSLIEVKNFGEHPIAIAITRFSSLRYLGYFETSTSKTKTYKCAEESFAHHLCGISSPGDIALQPSRAMERSFYENGHISLNQNDVFLVKINHSDYYCVIIGENAADHTTSIHFKQYFGELPAYYYPLIKFHTLLCLIYGILSVGFSIRLTKFRGDLVLAQKLSIIVLVISTAKSALFATSLSRWNNSGTLPQSYFILMAFIEAIDITFPTVLLLVISMGFGYSTYVRYSLLSDAKHHYDFFRSRVKTHRLKIISVFFLYFILGFTLTLRDLLLRAHRYTHTLDFVYLLLFALVTLVIFCGIIYFTLTTVTKFESTGQSIKANRYRRLFRLTILTVLFFVSYGFMFLLEICQRDYFAINWKKAWIKGTVVPNIIYLIGLCTILYTIRPRKRTVIELEESSGLISQIDELTLSSLSFPPPEDQLEDLRPSGNGEKLWNASSIKRTVYSEFLSETERGYSKAE